MPQRSLAMSFPIHRVSQMSQPDRLLGGLVPTPGQGFGARWAVVRRGWASSEARRGCFVAKNLNLSLTGKFSHPRVGILTAWANRSFP